MKPIIFSGSMIRAILNGGKTQTRRVVGPKWKVYPGAMMKWSPLCPYGQIGDRLWVRETCRAKELTDKEAKSLAEKTGDEKPRYGLDGVEYLSDNHFKEIENSREASEAWCALNAYRGKKGAVVPPIFMPRWASRITLEITQVRVQRLNEISEDDCKAEGMESAVIGGTGINIGDFQRLWDSINEKAPWESNPWIWALTFRRIS